VPAIIVKSDWNRDALKVSAKADVAFYASNSGENFQDYESAPAAGSTMILTGATQMPPIQITRKMSSCCAPSASYRILVAG